MYSGGGSGTSTTSNRRPRASVASDSTRSASLEMGYCTAYAAAAAAACRVSRLAVAGARCAWAHWPVWPCANGLALWVSPGAAAAGAAPLVRSCARGGGSLRTVANLQPTPLLVRVPFKDPKHIPEPWGGTGGTPPEGPAHRPSRPAAPPRGGQSRQSCRCGRWCRRRRTAPWAATPLSAAGRQGCKGSGAEWVAAVLCQVQQQRRESGKKLAWSTRHGRAVAHTQAAGRLCPRAWVLAGGELMRRPASSANMPERWHRNRIYFHTICGHLPVSVPNPGADCCPLPPPRLACMPSMRCSQPSICSRVSSGLRLWLSRHSSVVSSVLRAQGYYCW